MASVASIVYRFDKAALRDWTASLGESQLKLLPRNLKLKRDTVCRLQIEFLETCIPTGVVLSLGTIADPVADE